MSEPTIAVIGLGEAGSRYAAGLASAGARVRGFDPHHAPELPGVVHADSAAAAVAGTDLVLSLVHGRLAVEVAEHLLPHVAATTVYADLNAASPDAMRAVAQLAADHGVSMADVAVLAPVPRAGHATPLLASGDGAASFAAIMSPLGVPVEVVDAPAGAAAERKLLRSVFMKGLAAVVLESLDAARAADAEAWMRDHIAAELDVDGQGHQRVARLVDGTRIHAARREQEMHDALTELEALGAPTDMTRATLAWLARLRAAGAAD
ncbi:3-hydroxyisobutyrate dehydrogenase-like beta-hydroxyacid dehydrogenase [Microbacterium sp. SLBN-154]|uniref:NAD(P)-binding domain-containing protein n=1 Tax=Microbacterium sp. SLBN-154 TaxID=2768458 RepID=UPI00116F0F0D|nr:NAD(P)-binding domain-containing protein [Microbacterium sp. SLBN-154]TQK18265.1 3-hydroxyisobutyrate dehydrogenase-like beta-hydroxyacid dehydrogenase [Microbacterium sp. SLBN-154]